MDDSRCDESQERFNAQHSRMFKNCESFLSRMNRSYPSVYSKLVHLTKSFAVNPRQPVRTYHDELQRLFSDCQDMVGEINKLLYTDARIVVSRGREEPFGYLTECLKPDSEKARLLEEALEEIKGRKLEMEAAINVLGQKFREDPETQQMLLSLLEKHQQQKKKKAKDWSLDLKKKVRQEPPEPSVTEVAQQKGPPYYFQNISAQSYFQSRDIKNEILVFETIHHRATQNLKTEDAHQFFQEFMKVISLFTECIVTWQEVVDLFAPIPWIEKELVDEIAVILQSRQVSRRQSCVLFKPLKDTDFKNAERVSRSYVRMHPGYANNVTHGSSLMNQKWVSVPFGSEDYSFQIMRKNTYEEQLFKIEDEKYEFDVNLQQYRAVIRLLGELGEGKNSAKATSIVQKILQLKVLQQIYKSSFAEQQEILTYLQKFPQECAPILKERVEQKYQEMQDARNNNARLVWEGIQLTNFHRSLDHRSFYFKKNEKQFTCPSKFLKESEERYKALIQHFYPSSLEEQRKKISENPFKLEELQKYLNSFQNLTTFEPLSKDHICPLIPPPDINNFLRLPLFNLYLPNKNIMDDTFQFLLCYIKLNTNSEFAEKFIIQIARGLLDQPISSMDSTQLITNEQQLKTEVHQIEQQIFDVNFSYLQTYMQAQQPEENNNNANGKKENSAESPNNNNNITVVTEPQAEENQSESQLSKMLTVPPQQEQDIYTISNVLDHGARWLNFIPKDESQKVFYGPQCIYVFFRYFYAIYQRLEVANNISFHFDVNRKTGGFTQQQKYSYGVKRYMLFKSALYQSLKQKEFKFEDYLRSIYAKQAFLFGTMEKLFADTCKLLLQMQSDRITEAQLSMVFLEHENHKYTGISEEIQLALLTHSLIENSTDKNEKNIYRFSYAHHCDSLTVNFIPATRVEKHQLQKTSVITAALTQTRRQTLAGVYMKRAIRKPQKLRFLNALEFLVAENAELRLHGGNGDYIVARRPNAIKSRRAHVIKGHVKSCNQVLEMLSRK